MRIALDGPLNGQWIDAETAVFAGYFPARWPNGELVWMHVNGYFGDDDE